MTYTGLNGKKYITKVPCIGKGAEGEVFALQSSPNLVLKVYHKKHQTQSRERKIKYMVNNPPHISAFDQLAWPEDVVYINGKFAGYTMRCVSKHEPLNNLYSSEIKSTLSERITVAKNLCAATNSVHTINQVVGDFNPNNIMVDLNKCTLYLVDTDSFHISGDRTYRCEVGLPQYIANEVTKNGTNLSTAALPTYSKESDLFALAVHIFELIMGAHPFACATSTKNVAHNLALAQSSVVAPQPLENIKDGFFPFYDKKSGFTIPVYAPELSSLPTKMQDLFINAFVKGHKNPAMRPTATQWYDALCDMQKHLKQCPADNKHMYAPHNAQCPYCVASKNFINLTSTFSSGGKFAPPQVSPATNAFMYTPPVYPAAVQNTPAPKKINKVVLILAILVALYFLGLFININTTSSNAFNPPENTATPTNIEETSLTQDDTSALIENFYSSFVNSINERDISLLKGASSNVEKMWRTGFQRREIWPTTLSLLNTHTLLLL